MLHTAYSPFVATLFVTALLALAVACHPGAGPNAGSATTGSPAPAAAAAKTAESTDQPLAVGTQAPDFTLTDSHGSAVTLSSFRGKKNVVLVFYPGDETPGCTKQLCSVRDDFKDFETAGITVFGVNPGTAESHREFIDHQKYPFELLVDTGSWVTALYQAKGPLTTNRTVYGIDKTGTIVFAERGMPADTKIVAAFAKK